MRNTKVDIRKIAIIAGVVILIIIIIAVFAGGKDKETEENKPFEPKVLEGEKLAEVKKYGELEISNVKFQVEEKMTEVTADVLNNTANDIEGQYVSINILDKDGNVITDVGGYISDIESGQTGKLVGSFLTSEATSNAYNVEITDKKLKNNDTDVQNEENGQNSVNNNSNSDTNNTNNTSGDDTTI